MLFPVLQESHAIDQRTNERPKLNDGDRVFWSMACEFPRNWREPKASQRALERFRDAFRFASGF